MLIEDAMNQHSVSDDDRRRRRALADKHEPRQTFQQATDEAAARELLESQELNHHLKGERSTYRALAASALEMVARLTQRNKQLAARIDHLNTQLREMFNAPCLTCRRAGRQSDRAA